MNDFDDSPILAAYREFEKALRDFWQTLIREFGIERLYDFLVRLIERKP